MMDLVSCAVEIVTTVVLIRIGSSNYSNIVAIKSWTCNQQQLCYDGDDTVDQCEQQECYRSLVPNHLTLPYGMKTSTYCLKMSFDYHSWISFVSDTVTDALEYHCFTVVAVSIWYIFIFDQM